MIEQPDRLPRPNWPGWQGERTLARQGGFWGCHEAADLIAVLGGAAVAWRGIARAQQSGMPFVGPVTVFPEGSPIATSVLAAFRAGLGEEGFVADRNVAIGFRSGDSKAVLDTIAAEYVSRNATVSLRLAVQRPRLHSRTRPKRFQSSLRWAPIPSLA